MRVIAGKCRSLPLKTVPGTDTRPTTDRVKETLFNMLQPYLLDCRFLDLFGGSGAIGIEDVYKRQILLFSSLFSLPCAPHKYVGVRLVFLFFYNFVS